MDRFRCAKHRNCEMRNGSHFMTLISEMTIIDFRAGTVVTQNMLDQPNLRSNQKDKTNG